MPPARHGRVIGALAGLCLAQLCPAPAAAEAIAVSATPVPLNESDTQQVAAGRLQYLAGFRLRSPDDRFGGLSGLLVEGDRAILVSDHGRWLQARLAHDVTGRLVGVDQVQIAPLLDLAGRPVTGRLGWRDAESVRRLADGRLLVSFEVRHRLWAYAPGDDLANARPRPLPVPRQVGQGGSNGGLEAVAEYAPGKLLALSESLRGPEGDLVGWRLAGRNMQAVRYVADGAFVPTDLASLPSGDLLVLERRFSILGGVAGQLRLIPRRQLGAAVLRPLPLARLERPINVDNFEGLAVVERGGETLVYVVSDDNFNPLQRTLLLQFRLMPAAD